jgi:hypothetical protein
MSPEGKAALRAELVSAGIWPSRLRKAERCFALNDEVLARLSYEERQGRNRIADLFRLCAPFWESRS